MIWYVWTSLLPRLPDHAKVDAPIITGRSLGSRGRFFFLISVEVERLSRMYTLVNRETTWTFSHAQTPNGSPRRGEERRERYLYIYIYGRQDKNLSMRFEDAQ